VRSPEQILAESRTIAIVGASPDPDRPSHGVMRYLLQHGYRCIPVRPLDCDEVLGVPCVATLADIAEPIDVVDVFRRPDALVGHAREAVDEGARALWLQLGLASPEARVIATEAGLDYVEDACTAVVHRRVAPVRDRGPVEGVWGDREVPPAT
jgi:predicted CoA-binding protein